MADKPKGTPMKLRITSCASVYQGINKRGDDYCIYELSAAKEDGTGVDQKLRSFEELPVGELLDLTVTPFHSEKHGTSFTLSRKNKPGGGGSSRKVEELTQFVQAIDERLKRLELLQASPAEVPAAPGPIAGEAVGGQSLDERFGADVPF